MNVSEDYEARQKCVVEHWNYKGLLELEADFCKNHAHIERLYLKRNKLRTLPKEIALLTSLVELYVPGNEIQELPPEIGDMKNLKFLDVSSNYIEHLPRTIGQLHKLQKLVVSINKLCLLPKEMEQLVCLETLEAIHNNMHIFPSQLCQCKNLQTLCLDCNNLKFIPRQVVKLQRLKTLSISGNKLLSLPYTLLQMSRLQNIYVDNNPSLFVFPYGASYGNYRCGTHPICEDEDEFLTVKIEQQGCISKLYLGPDMKELNQPYSKNVPHLLELCLRILSISTADQHSLVKNLESHLPRELCSILDTASGTCFDCQKTLYTSAFPLILRAKQSETLYDIIFYCSQNCLFKCSDDLKVAAIYPLYQKDKNG
ncbi:hypothetical protein SNE40_011412 [Patella caerulea]|uniref:Disease resistance R13L4/SHOC-2-like LRR domain-containing protein n=1 Tax=Patella caerulea TaxID=87958 RepID=A0AAN8JPA2_PATCE